MDLFPVSCVRPQVVCGRVLWLVAGGIVLSVSACVGRDRESGPRLAESPRQALAKLLDTAVTEGRKVQIDGPVSSTGLRGCDQLPDSSSVSGEAVLAPRRQFANGVYAQVAPNLVLAEQQSADLKEVVGAIRARYEQEALPLAAPQPIDRIDIEPFTITYAPSFSGLADSVVVHGRRLTLRVVGPGGAPRLIDAYYLNYDKVNAASPRILFMLNGPMTHREAGFELEPTGSYAALATGQFAIHGLPILAFDDTSKRLEDMLSAVRALDRAILTSFRRVDVIGRSDPVFHLLAFHQSHIASAYVDGPFLPLWTRNDTAARSGGPFGTDLEIDNRVVQSRFQWADFALMALDEGIKLGLANHAGSSGISKAGLFVEVLPALKRFPAADGSFVVRGNDRDGDGVGDNGEGCRDGEFADFLDFLKTVGAAR